LSYGAPIVLETAFLGGEKAWLHGLPAYSEIFSASGELPLSKIRSVVSVVDVRFWHKADNPTALGFVRFWTKADGGRSED